MKNFLLFVLPCLIGLFVLLGGGSSVEAAETYGPQKVVYHFNTNNVQINNAGLANIQNHINAVGKENLKLVAVVHSSAWEMVAKNKAVPQQVEKMKALIEQGVQFDICRNTLQGVNLDPEKDLVIPMTVVPAGVAELVKLQQEGYAYIKP
jgi:uncharacterized protein